MAAQTFDVEGSDLLLGVGSKSKALSGAVSAGVNDIYSVYWNPAGLAELTENQASISGQLNAKMIPVNFAGVALTGEWLRFAGLKSSIALSWITRLHVKATGAYTANDLESVFLRFALPDLPGDFNGTIESKTKDYRLTWAVMPEEDADWSFGVAVSRIDCKTFFCGVTADNPGQYKISTTKASTYAFHVGGKYFYSDDLTFAFNLNDINTKLDVAIKTVYQNGTVQNKVLQTSFPRDLTIGTQWRYSPDMIFSFDYQMMFGNYGNYKMNMQIARAGFEYIGDSLQYRFGLLAPLKIKMGNVSDLSKKAIFPVAPSLGIGWENESIAVDAALYMQLLMSAQRNRPVPGLDISLTSKF
ncbi:hypothetical protein [Mariprofundus aestuarium]|nr:hypothetical protein [Mariprofundus aestuarium]